MPQHKFIWEPVADRAQLRDVGFSRLSTTLSVPASRLAKGIRSSIEIAGIPTVAGATPLDEALIFLEAAAELEHALAIQYLFVGFSC